MWSMSFVVSTVVAVIFAAAADNGQVTPTAQTGVSQADSTKAASAKSLTKADQKKCEVSDDCDGAYRRLFATYEKFEEILKRQPDDVVALQRYPVLLRKQLRTVVKTHAQAVKQGEKSGKAHSSSGAQSLEVSGKSKPIPKSVNDRQQDTDNTHGAPDPAELRKRALQSLRNVPPTWVLESSRRAEKLLDQISAILVEQEYDAKQLKRKLDELKRAFENIARPKKSLKPATQS